MGGGLRMPRTHTHRQRLSEQNIKRGSKAGQAQDKPTQIGYFEKMTSGKVILISSTLSPEAVPNQQALRL